MDALSPRACTSPILPAAGAESVTVIVWLPVVVFVKLTLSLVLSYVARTPAFDVLMRFTTVARLSVLDQLIVVPLMVKLPDASSVPAANRAADTLAPVFIALNGALHDVW